jgi:hypothetical protein
MTRRRKIKSLDIVQRLTANLLRGDFRFVASEYFTNKAIVG